MTIETNYRDMPVDEAFRIFERNVLLAGGITLRNQDAAHATLDEIGRHTRQYTGVVNTLEIPDLVWPGMDKELKTTLVGGSLARHGWVYGNPRAKNRDILYKRCSYPQSMDRYQLYNLDSPDLVDKATDMAVAANQEHMRIASIPAPLLPDNAEVFTAGSPEQRTRLLGSLAATRWDFEIFDSTDTHPITNWLHSKAVPEFKSHLLDLALDDAEDPNSRIKLRLALKNSYDALPEAFSDAQVKRIRRLFGWPEDDEAYAEHLRAAEAEEGRLAQERHVQSEKQRLESNARKQEVRDAAIAYVKQAITNRRRDTTPWRSIGEEDEMGEEE